MKKPNIVFILSDDHGQWANGTYGNKEIITPNIDSLASRGVKFNNFFCTSPVCSPARASILTGKIPSQHGVHDWICGGSLNEKEWSETTIHLKDYLNTTTRLDNKYSDLLAKKVIDENALISIYDTPEWKEEMRYENHSIEYLEGQETYTKVLADNDYNVALSGKWHLGATSKKQCGFKTWLPVARGGTPYMHPEMIVDDKVIIEDSHVTELITSNAIDFLKEYKDENPFYLSIHYTAPHSPWSKENQIPEIWDLYENLALKDTSTRLHSHIASDAPYPRSKEQALEFKRGYYSSVTTMDKGIGDVLSTLNEIGIADNTIVIYTSDNGISLGQHGVWGKGNGTFPLNFYEESIKVPFIYYDPRTGINKVENSMVSQYDIFPTLIDMCGINYKFDDSYPGRSFMSLLESEKPDDKMIVVYDEYGPNRMIRNEYYKYVHRYPYGPNEFYNLKVDSGEKNNAIDDSKYEDEINHFKHELEKWFFKYVDPNVDGIASNCYGVGQTKKMDRKLGCNDAFRIRN